MMRLWKEDYSRPVRRGPSTATSLIVHGIIIFLAILATNPPPGLATLWDLANRVYYLVPPTRAPSADQSTAKLQYVDGAAIGSGSGFAASKLPAAESAPRKLLSRNPGDLGTELIAAAESRLLIGTDSVFTLVDVDSAVAIDPTSAVPRYPEELRKLGIEGLVQVQYVVESTGLADSASVEVLRATHPEFALAVRQALPYMHFIPARIGAKPVSQLVVQQFNFQIERPKSDSVAARKPPQEH